MKRDQRYDAIIVGGGVAGLSAARQLQGTGSSVLVLESNLSPGGRLRSPRIEGSVFDDGAPFFQVHDVRFQRIVDRWIASGIVREWTRGYVRDDGTVDADGEPRYCGVPGMSAIPEALAEGLSVRCNARVTAVREEGGAYTVFTSDAQEFRAVSVILAVPVPHVPSMLHKVDSLIEKELQSIRYAPLLTILALCTEDDPVPGPGIVQPGGPVASLIVDNTKKGMPSDRSAVTIHTTTAFSRQFFDRPDGVVIAAVVGAVEKWLDLSRARVQVTRWPHARVLQTINRPYVTISKSPPLVCAGDGVAGTRVEQAAMSGIDAAEHVRELLGLPEASSEL